MDECRFAENRTSAYLALIHELNQNAEALSAVIPEKDFIDILLHIEGFIKEESGGKSGGSMIEMFQNFLETNSIPQMPDEEKPFPVLPPDDETVN